MRRWLDHRDELAYEIARRDLFRRPSDGAPPPSDQPRLRAGRYSHLFECSDTRCQIRLCSRISDQTLKVAGFVKALDTSAFTCIWREFRSSETESRNASKTPRRSSGSAAASASVRSGRDLASLIDSDPLVGRVAESCESNRNLAAFRLSASMRSRTMTGSTPPRSRGAGVRSAGQGQRVGARGLRVLPATDGAARRLMPRGQAV